jgi:hypothetical protein
MSSLARALWIGMPGRVGRVSAILGAALNDGAYLTAWPVIALLAPVGAAALGFVLGATHEGYVYTYSLLTMALLAAVAGLGSGLGLAAWTGYVLGDLLLFPRSTSEFGPLLATPGLTEKLIQVYFPLALSYVILGLLLVVIPLVATAVGTQLARALGPRLTHAQLAGQAVATITQAALAFSWAQMTAFLIRPIWTFHGAVPTIEAISPLQQHAGILALVTAAAAGSRVFLIRSGGTSATSQIRAPRTWPWWLAVPSKAVVLTVLLSGLMDTIADAVIFAGLLGGIFFLQAVVVPRLPFYEIVQRIPIAPRYLVVVLLAYLLASVIVEPAVTGGQSSFRSLLLTLLLTMAASAFVLPSQRKRESGAGR